MHNSWAARTYVLIWRSIKPGTWKQRRAGSGLCWGKQSFKGFPRLRGAANSVVLCVKPLVRANAAPRVQAVVL